MIPDDMIEDNETYQIIMINTALPFNVKAGHPVILFTKDNDSLCKCSKIQSYICTCIRVDMCAFLMCILYMHIS